MSSDQQPKQGLFSSLTLGRARPSKRSSSETLAHPLLGASTSSLNINEANEAGPSQPSLGSTARQPSMSEGIRSVSTSSDVLNLPYKPRQRVHGHGSTNSVSSISSLNNPTTSTAHSTAGLSTPVVSTSPVTPTGISTTPITATSTSTTFAIPPSSTAETLSSESVTPSTAIAGSSSSATSRLQLQSLKAAAQKMGLGNGSMGMMMIDTIFEKGQAGRGRAESGEWSEVLKLISAGKVVLLLPTSPAPSLPITPQILRDHIAFVSPSIPLPEKTQRTDSVSTNGESSMTSVSVIVTTSGIVGSTNGTTLNIDSTLAPESPLLSAICDPLSRIPTISTLRPTSIYSTSHSPSFTISTEAAILPFPPLNKASSTSTAEEKNQKAPAGKLGRINPFASFFGGSATASPALGSSPNATEVSGSSSPSRNTHAAISPDRPLSPTDAGSPASSVINSNFTGRAPDAETASIRSNITSRDLEGYSVTAYTVSKPLRHAELSKSLNKAIKTTIRDELHRLPEKVVEKVIKLVTAGACPTYTSTTDKSDAATYHFDYTDPSAAGDKMQAFIEDIYDDLVLHFRADSSHIFGEKELDSIRRKASWTRKGLPAEMVSGENESEEAKKERREKMRREKDALVEKEATEGTERVERVICRLLYNRLFSPLESDDARHDEALSSRIAALNMLDLSLDHLGLITRPDDVPANQQGVIAEGLAGIVDRIGHELTKLSRPDCLTPRDKAEILIHAHKIVVDGLAELPPINLRPEGEPYRPSPRSSSPVNPGETTSDALFRVISPASSVAEALAANDTATSSDLATSSPLRKSSSSSSSLLSVPSPASDPLSSIEEVLERTPRPSQTSPPADVPQLVLPDSSESEIKEAMSDSMMTINGAEKPRSSSPEQGEKSSAPKVSTSGADLILPIIIYAVVKSNPPQLASQLMYLRRYRSAICLTGEASYAIVNLTAVVEFLEHVELSQLGLGDDSDKVISVEDLSPIGLNYLDESNADAASIASASSRLRGRVFQVGELAGSAADSANKVLTGVVDSSWTALRGLIATPNANAAEESSEAVPSPTERPGMRPRGASTFSLASVTASVATIAAAAASRSRSRANSRASAMAPHSLKEEHTWKGNEEMMEVTSRPASIREKGQAYLSSSDEDSETDDERPEDSTSRRRSDTRSVKSVSSPLSRQRSQDVEAEGRERVSIGDRLASIGVLGRTGTPDNALPSEQPQGKATGFLAGITSGRNASGTHNRRLSLLGGSRIEASPSGSHISLPATINPTTPAEQCEPPIEQFMTCEVGDIKLSEVGILLRDYRRLGAFVNSLQSKASS